MPTKVGFILLSPLDRPQPSTRISVTRMLPFLERAGFEPYIVFEPKEGTETPDLTGLAPRVLGGGLDIVYFQKVYSPGAVSLARELSAAGVRTVYGVCDVVKPEMAAATDATITVTEYLKSLYPRELQSRVHVVHDGIERAEVQKTAWRSDRGSRSKPLDAVLVTSSNLDRLPVLERPPEWLRVTVVGRFPPRNRPIQRLREARWQFISLGSASERASYVRFIASRRVRREAWDPDGVYTRMLGSDIGIIPIDPTTEPDRDLPSAMWRVRSENRLTMKMCLGLPVVATPVPAYEAVVRSGENGFLCDSRSEWMDALTALRDPDFRRQLGKRARRDVVERYSKEEQARLLIEVLKGIIESPAARA
jgi:glycosyltransferase involved in cell wall biosynthesis